MGGNGHLGQGHRCRRDAQHVVGAGFGDDPVQSRGEVGDSPAGGAVVGRTVGTQVDQGTDRRPVDAHDSCLGEGLQWQWRELLGGDLLLKQPEPDGPSQRIGATHEGPGGRGGAVSRQSELPGVPDGGHNGVREEADINEGVPQLFDLVGGEVSAHGGNLGAWPFHLSRRYPTAGLCHDCWPAPKWCTSIIVTLRLGAPVSGRHGCPRIVAKPWRRPASHTRGSIKRC